MALVIDEFGGTRTAWSRWKTCRGVVGDIADEYDEAGPAHTDARPGGLFEATPRASLDELEAAMGEPMAPGSWKRKSTPSAGWSPPGRRVPQRGEVISPSRGFEFEVTDADPRRIKDACASAAVPSRRTRRGVVQAARPLTVERRHAGGRASISLNAASMPAWRRLRRTLCRSAGAPAAPRHGAISLPSCFRGSGRDGKHTQGLGRHDPLGGDQVGRPGAGWGAGRERGFRLPAGGGGAGVGGALVAANATGWPLGSSTQIETASPGLGHGGAGIDDLLAPS